MLRSVMDSPSFPSDIKGINRQRTIQPFLSGKAISASEAGEAIGLSRITAMKSIQFFVGKGLLVSAGKGASTTQGGKRPELFALNPNKYFLCVTLWPDEMQVHLLSLSNQPVAQAVQKAPLPPDPKEAIANVGHVSGQLLSAHGIGKEQVCAVSVSTSGIFDYEQGVLKFSSNSPEWGVNIPMRAYLQPYFAPGTLLFFENAGKMTARQYLNEPAYENQRVMVVFTCWGVSSCLMDKQHILNGQNSLIGEIGHMTIDPHDHELCGCGNHGCLERLVSLTRVRQMVAEGLASLPDSLLAGCSGEAFTMADLFAASQAGDALARRVVDRLAVAFAAAIRNASLLFDPSTVIFQGDYAWTDAYFQQRLSQELCAFRYYSSPRPMNMVYDQRELTELDWRGAFEALTHLYFGNPALYQGDSDA